EREATPKVLLVDISGAENPVASLDALASVCAPDVSVLVVGEQTEIGFYRELTRDLGVTEYLHKPLTRDKVTSLFAPHITALSSEAMGAERGGRIVAVGGVCGGVGSTTVATNLALQIAESTHAHVALLDLHLRGGTTGLMLGAKPGSGLRIALEDPDRADSLFLDRVAIPVADRVRLIAAEEPFDVDPRPTEAAMARMLDLLRLRFNHIVVDLRLPPEGIDRQVLAAARHRVLVLGPDMTSLRNAVGLRRMLASGTGTGRTLTVLNRAGRPGGLKAELVSEGLDGAPDVVIPDLPRHLPRAANLGRPALRESARFRRALAPLTQEIGGKRMEAGRPSLLKRLFRRGATS
ncbi:MAG TPA: hypothetical protein VIL69_16015, partial [Roseomonas sp.]